MSVCVCVCVSVSGVRSGHFVCLLLLHLFDSTGIVEEEDEDEEETVAGGFCFSFVERFVATPRLRAVGRLVMCVCVCCVCSETVSN